MPRPEKVQAVEEIKERFENAEATFLTEYRGLSVNEQQELRRGLRAAGAEYKVVKMSLARRAALELGLDEFTESMNGPTAIAFASADPVPVAKALKDFAKDHERLVLKVGLMSGKLLAPEQVSKLADIEPRDVLLSKIAGAAKAPLAKMAGMLASFTRDSASMFSQLLEKKDEATAPAAAEPEAAEEAADAEPEEAASVETTKADEQPAAESEEEAADVEAEEPDVADAEPEEEAAAGSTDVEADEEDNTPEASADDAEVEESSEEEAGSDDSATSDSDNDDAADEAEEE
jgi:large subunit ribosomal protein L10